MKDMTFFTGDDSDADEKLILYHGSSSVVDTPKWGIGKPDNDYGSGFYTTEFYDKAASWALLNGTRDAYVNKYTLDVRNLKIINLNDFGVLAWLSEVLANRGTFDDSNIAIADEIVKRYRIPIEDADVVIGYRADDSYTEVIEAFLNKLLSIDEVKRLFYKGKLGNQVFIKSKQAFLQTSFVKAEKVVYDQNLVTTDISARREAQMFLNNRRLQVAKGFQVPSLNVTDVLQNMYRYVKEYDYYECV